MSQTQYPPLKFTFSGGPFDGREFKLPPDAPKVMGGLWIDIPGLMKRGVFVASLPVIIDGKPVPMHAKYAVGFNAEAKTYSAQYIDGTQILLRAAPSTPPPIPEDVT